MPFTTDDLVSAVRLRCRIAPASDITAADILSFATEALSSEVMDIVRRSDASYGRTTIDVTLASSAEILIPIRAHFSQVQQVTLIDGTSRVPVERLADEDAHLFEEGPSSWWQGPIAYTLTESHLRLLPGAAEVAGKTLRITYHRRPPELVATSEAAAIVSPTGPTQINLGVITPPSAISTNGTLIDIIRGDGVYEPLYTDRIVDSWGSPDLDLDSSTPIVVGDIATAVAGGRTDYVCVAGQSVYPMVPRDFWPVLVSATSVGVLEALGDRQGMAAAQATLTARADRAHRMAAPRTRETPPLINRDSRLRQGRVR